MSEGPAAGAKPPCRVIAHIDLDAFYAQVEERRLGIPPGADIPFVVIQWNMLIAVNYAARKYGVSRFESLAESIKKCPHLRYIHVQTFSQDGKEAPAYHPHPKKATHKVSLDAYRDASSKIFSVLDQFCGKLQKASVDEAYLDLTEPAWQRLQSWTRSRQSEGKDGPPANPVATPEQQSSLRPESSSSNGGTIQPTPIPPAPTFLPNGEIDWAPVGSIKRDSELSSEEMQWFGELDAILGHERGEESAGLALPSGDALDEGEAGNLFSDDPDDGLAEEDKGRDVDLDDLGDLDSPDNPDNLDNLASFHTNHPDLLRDNEPAPPPIRHQERNQHSFNDARDVSLLMLWFGAQITLEIRNAVLVSLDYHCSAGISHNKMLSKIASAQHKPNKQTTITAAGAIALLRALPIRKIRGLGGKLGREAQTRLGAVETAGDVWRFSLHELKRRLGDDIGTFLFNSVRGIDLSPVVERTTTKSMQAVKSFSPPVTTVEVIKDWLAVLSSELVARMKVDKRVPKTLRLGYRPAIHGPSENGYVSAWARAQTGTSVAYSWGEFRSRSCPMPYDRFSVPTLANTAFQMLPEDPREILPCIILALSADGLTEGPVHATKSIVTMFRKAQDRIAQQQQQQQQHGQEHTQDRTQEHTQEHQKHAVHPAPPSLPPSSRSISAFFARQPGDSDSAETSELLDSGLYYLCAKCKQHVRADVEQEHEDFHLAASLQEMERTEQLANHASPNAPSARPPPVPVHKKRELESSNHPPSSRKRHHPDVPPSTAPNSSASSSLLDWISNAKKR